MKAIKIICTLSLVTSIFSGLEAQVKPTNEWVNFYGSNSLYQGKAIPVGAQINAYDPQGILCGSFTVTKAGEYGFLAVYRDDAWTTTIDEGAAPGDTIRFTINGAQAILLIPGINVWSSNGAVIKAELTDNRAPIIAHPMKDVDLTEDAPAYQAADLDTIFSDPDKDVLTFSVQSSVAEIQASLDQEHRLGLTVSANWNGMGQVIVMASDGILTVGDTVKVTVKAGNDAPIVLHPIKDVVLTEDVPAYQAADLDTVFSDPDKDVLTFSVQSSVAEIQASLDQEHRLGLTVSANWNGMGQVIVMASDGLLTVGDTVKVTVKAGNDAPIVLHPIKDVILTEDAPAYQAADLDTVFSDPDKDMLMFSVQSSVAEIQASLDQEHRLGLTVSANWNGMGQVIVMASDGILTVGDTVKVTVKAGNDAPIVLHPIKDVVLTEDAPAYQAADLDTVFSDPDKDMLMFSVQSSVAEIQASLDQEHRLGLTVSANWNGMGQVIVMASDGLLTVGDTVKVTVKAGNDAPIVLHPIKDVILTEDAPAYQAADLDTVFSDPDKDMLMFSVQSSVAEIQASLDQEHRLGLTVSANWNGMGQVIVMASDGLLTVGDTVKVTVKAGNDAPIVLHPIKDVVLTEDAPAYQAADLDTIFSDPDKDPLLYTIEFDSSMIMAEKNNENQLIIQVQQNKNGMTQIILRADDGYQAVLDTMIIDINPINDPPQIMTIPDTVVVLVNNDSLVLDLTNYATDVEEGSTNLNWSLQIEPNKGDSVRATVDALHIARIKAFYNFIGILRIIFTVEDSCGASDNFSVLLKIENLVGLEIASNKILPLDYSLCPNYPNPFNPETTIRFALPQDGDVEMAIYNIQGQQVRLLRREFFKAGWHELHWNGLDDYSCQAGSGVYMVRMIANDLLRIQKMTLLR